MVKTGIVYVDLSTNIEKILQYPLYMTPVINNTLKVGQMVVLHLNKQWVTYMRLAAFANTGRAILQLRL